MFKVKQFIFFLITILFVLNTAYSTVWSGDSRCEYSGYEYSASDFQCQFISDDFVVKFFLSTQINLSDMDQNSVNFLDDKIYFNSTQFNSKTTTFNYTNLYYNYNPVYLRNGIVFSPSSQNFNNLTYKASFTNTINNLENYQISKNSKLNITPTQQPHFNTTVDFTVAYLDSSNNNQIPSSTCTYFHNSITNNISGGTFQILFDSQIESFLVTCNANSYEEITSQQNIQTLTQPIDNFSVDVSFTEYLGSPTVFADKNLDILITSIGTNNMLSNWNTKYFFGLSWNEESIDQSTLLYNQWFEIGKNENLNLLGNSSEETTFTDLIPSTNFSMNLFRNEKDGFNQDKSLILNVKACSTNWLGAQNCIYNYSSYFIFKDLTPPQITKSINGGFLKDNNNIQFDYTVFDYESDVKSLKYVIIENGTTPIEPTQSVIGFNSNTPSTFTTSNQGLENGKYYKFIFKAENGVLVESSNIFSNEFLIDIYDPINSNLTLNLNSEGFAFSNITTINLTPGKDYNLNYSTLNLTESGLNHTKLTITKHILLNNNCLNQIENYTDYTYDTANRTETFDFETGHCYELDYFVFDKSNNVNTISPSQQIKIDTSFPTIIGTIDDSSNSQNYNFDESQTIFRTVWTFEDLESGLRDYEIYLLKETELTNKTLVKTFTNITSPYVDIKYNSTYIEDGAEYFVQVKATNRANLTTPIYESNGITLFESVVPELKVRNELFLNFDFVMFDYTNDNTTQVIFEDVNNLNIICRYYENDVSYDDSEGNTCSTVGGNITCNLPTTQNTQLLDYHISCLNLDQIDNTRNKNDETNNFDLGIYLEYNVKPTITQVNYNSNYSSNINETTYNILENESLTFTITSIDDNEQNSYLSNYLFDNNKTGLDKLEVSFNIGRTYPEEIFQIFFSNTYTSLSVPLVQMEDSYLHILFNQSINKTQLESLLSVEKSLNLSIIGADNATFNNSVTLNSSIDINSSNYVLTDIFGISNIIQIKKNETFNITQNQVSTNTYEFTYTPNTNQRVGIQKTNITFSDDILNNSIEFTFNITPIYYAPKINTTFQFLPNTTNSKPKFEIGESKILDLSNYIYEENGIVELNSILKYQILTDNSTFNIDNFNSNSPILNLTFLQNVSTLEILTTNFKNQSIYLELDLEVLNYVVPTINVTDELNSNIFDYTNRQTSYLEFNFNSTKPLYNATLNINSEYFTICSGCLNKTKLINSNDLIIGLNTYTVIFIGTDLIPYTQTGTFNFSFTNQSNISNIQDSFLSNIPLNVKINDSNNLTDLINNKLNSTQTIKILNNLTNTTLVEFNYDFNLDNLSIVGTKILYEENTDVSTILISNLQLQTQSQSRTKIVSIKAPQDTSTYNSVCVKDEELNSITQISQNCNQNNEYVIICNNVAQNSLTCTHNTNSSKYIISGLRHSGITIFDSTNYVNPNPGGGSGGGSGGSGGSGSSEGSSGGGSSSGGGFIFENQTQIKNDSQTEINNTIKISFDKFENQKLKLNFSKEFNFNINDLQIIGKFIKSSGKLEFVETLSNSKVLEITTEIQNFDLDKDGFKESQIYYATEGITFYLNYELLEKPQKEIIVIPEIIEPEKTDNSTDLFEEPVIQKEKESINILLIIIILILICLVFGAAFYFYKKKNQQKNLILSESLGKDLSIKVPKVQSDGYILDKLISDHNILLMKLELEKLNRSGLTWTQIYIYLKNEGLTKSQIKYLFTFDTLIKNIKKFCDKNKADFGIQNKIRNESWITDCFFYERPIEQIVRDIGFMISGVNIYGFDEKRFQEFFIDEMITGASHDILTQTQKNYLDSEIKQKLFKFR
jgi:hypothetical protein